MIDKYLLRLLLERCDPAIQTILICMTADTGQYTDLCLYFNIFTKQLHMLRTFYNGAAQCSVRLVSNKQNGRFLSPQIMLQMMLDTSGITHTAGRNDNLRFLVKVDHLGFISGNCCLQSRKTNWIDTSIYQIKRIFVKVFHLLHKNTGSLNCQRTVHVYLKIIVSVDQLIFLDLTDKIQHFLRPAHCKCRNNHITAPVKGLLDHIRQILNIVRSRSMAAVAISGFHHDIVCILNIVRIPDQWLMFIADVTGKYDLFLHTIFFNPDFYRG